jgi:hypothetical protein
LPLPATAIENVFPLKRYDTNGKRLPKDAPDSDTVIDLRLGSKVILCLFPILINNIFFQHNFNILNLSYRLLFVILMHRIKTLLVLLKRQILKEISEWFATVSVIDLNKN